MKLVDVHSHMDYKQLDSIRENLLNDMDRKGIVTISNTTSRENYEYAKSLFIKSNDVVTVVPGLYPQDAESISDSDFENYIEYIKSEKPIAIGEIGLDKKWTEDDNLFKRQVEIFKKIIELGIKLDIPLIIHTRKAEKEVLDVIENFKKRFPDYNKYILHCFMGNIELIERVKELDLSCSIPLIVIINKRFQRLVKSLKVTNLLVETDSPFLNVNKDIVNTPLNIPKIYDKIAELKGLDKVEIKSIIYNNYMRLFM